RPELLREIHKEYIAAGCEVIYANTFGANALKLARTGEDPSRVIAAGVTAAKEAAAGTDVKVALDIGPLGELLEPLGTLSFERAYELFREAAVAGEKAGADMAVIETMTDLYEAKAALLAVKENTALPVFVTMSFEENGRTFTGCTVASMARTLTGLGANAIGLNCSLGPDKLAPLLRELCENTPLPVIAKPNAGLPDPIDGHYDMDAETFADTLAPLLDAGVGIFGGCCGTSPEFLRAVAERLGGRAVKPRAYRPESFVCTPVHPLPIRGVRIIGERINPTGKKRIQQALLEDDLDYIESIAISEEDAGADILDVNAGYPGVDEVSLLPRIVKRLQGAVSLPLQIDSSNPEAIEAALRVCSGKAAVNSVNGDEASLSRLLPIVKKYDASVVGLTLDKRGIPQTAEERFAIAKRILDAALACGIAREDVWIDCLTLTVSAQQEQACETLKALRMVREELGLQTVLGVSNISFGLPNRPLVTQTFLIEALSAGLTLPIINPNQIEMTDAVAAFRVLSGEDEACRDYVERFAQYEPPKAAAPSQSRSTGKERAPETTLSLDEAVARGLRAEAASLAREALASRTELELVDGYLIPALDRVGEGYEKGTVFLPQLLSAAQAAQAVFEVIRSSLAEKGGESVKRGSLAIATVRGDVHDIGKNIVKTVLENYGYEVLDLGRDVAPETIAEAVKGKGLRLVGLSALMTTTLPAMAETVALLKTLPEAPEIFVGGAVVTPEYAKKIGADYYAKDARESVEIARRVFG
ncbi:MAG: homocysteine S-methyltransferase family protein, partial [Oscillospiraceae bacterium]|nr:homocysteine S-methyltransferase family protein [Oscillospiraceae bacterium]